jgi:hypothetical protein
MLQIVAETQDYHFWRSGLFQQASLHAEALKGEKPFRMGGLPCRCATLVSRSVCSKFDCAEWSADDVLVDF